MFLQISSWSINSQKMSQPHQQLRPSISYNCAEKIWKIPNQNDTQAKTWSACNLCNMPFWQHCSHVNSLLMSSLPERRLSRSCSHWPVWVGLLQHREKRNPQIQFNEWIPLSRDKECPGPVFVLLLVSPVVWQNRISQVADRVAALSTRGGILLEKNTSGIRRWHEICKCLLLSGLRSDARVRNTSKMIRTRHKEDSSLGFQNVPCLFVDSLSLRFVFVLEMRIHPCFCFWPKKWNCFCNTSFKPLKSSVSRCESEESVSHVHTVKSPKKRVNFFFWTLCQNHRHKNDWSIQENKLLH